MKPLTGTASMPSVLNFSLSHRHLCTNFAKQKRETEVLHPIQHCLLNGNVFCVSAYMFMSMVCLCSSQMRDMRRCFVHLMILLF